MTNYTPDAKGGAIIRLQGKVSKIVRSLAKSSLADPVAVPEEAANLRPEVSEEAVTAAVEAWRARSSYLPPELIGDPVWGMLLELLQAELQERRVSLSRLCTVSEVAPTVAIRWVKALERYELVMRRVDRRRRDHDIVELSPDGSSALRRYFRQVVELH